jgi:segregation and condensation protein B
MMSEIKIKQIVEAAIFAASDALSLEKLKLLFIESQRPDKEVLLEVLQQLAEDYSERGVELIEVASGYRFQARADYSEWLQRLWQQRPPRYSRALFETLSLIAYKQPLTRGEIEDVRGVAVSSQIVKTLMDRGWVRVVGHRDLPGKPALLATTKDFLDYFNLKKLTDLPPLSELMDFDDLEKQLGLALPEGLQVERTDLDGALEAEAEALNSGDAVAQNDNTVEDIALAEDDNAMVNRTAVEQEVIEQQDHVLVESRDVADAPTAVAMAEPDLNESSEVAENDVRELEEVV